MLDVMHGIFTRTGKCMVILVVLVLIATAPRIACGADGIAVDPVKRTWAESLLRVALNGKQGPKLFAAMADLATKAREGGAADRDAILAAAIATMGDRDRPPSERVGCCDLIRRMADERGVPDLTQALLHDDSEAVRMQAAHALGCLSWDPAAREALVNASGQETSESVRKMISGWLAKPPAAKPSAAPVVAASAGQVEELAPSGPPQPPAGPPSPAAKPLPWPFEGDYKAQSIVYNYQYCADTYIHLALDFLHPAGTPVKAVDSGYVAAIWSKPPHRDDFFVVADKGVSTGWVYTHMDPRTYTFKDGDRVERGQVLGSITEFSLDGGKTRGDHLHLGYVVFSKQPDGRVNCHSIVDPISCFEWKDTEAPRFLPLVFLRDSTAEQFKPDGAGVVTVSGKVDILAAIQDRAWPGQKAVYGVPVVMLSISDGKNTMQKLVLDHRGDIGDWKQVKPLYLTLKETRELFDTSEFYQTLRVTKTNGDGIITQTDEAECWDTAGMGFSGKPMWPDGEYSVNVYAWDAAGNRGVSGARVQVRNKTARR